MYWDLELGIIETMKNGAVEITFLRNFYLNWCEHRNFKTDDVKILMTRSKIVCSFLQIIMQHHKQYIFMKLRHNNMIHFFSHDKYLFLINTGYK